MFFVIDDRLLQDLTTYLVKQPFIEVEKIINGLRQMKQVTLEEKEEVKE